MTKWEETYGPVLMDPQKIVSWSIRVSSTMMKPEKEELSELINQVSSLCDDYETFKLCLMSALTRVEIGESKFIDCDMQYSVICVPDLSGIKLVNMCQVAECSVVVVVVAIFYSL